MEHYTPSGYAVLADSAFTRGGGFLEGEILRARKSNEMGSNSNVPRSTWLAAVDTLLESALPSERQSAEWGLRALKGPFARLKTVLPADAHARYRILGLCVHLYNLRVRKVGLNQIRTVSSGEGTSVQPWVLSRLL